MQEKLLDIIRPILEAEGVELVDLELRGSVGNPLIRIFVDEPGGISIDRCVALSREIDDALEIEPLFAGAYRLEVSSPGIDRPLRTERDFQRNIGRLVEIRYENEEGIEETLTGKIVAASDEQVQVLPPKSGEKRIALDSIKQALIQINWKS